MASIDADVTSVSGSALTPAEQVEAALVGAPSAIPADETPTEEADATLVDLSDASTSGVGSDLAADMPADLAAASALVSSLASEITAQGSQASSAYSLLSAESALKLTQS